MASQTEQFYQQDSSTVLKAMQSTETGLTAQQVSERLNQYGPNKLVAKRRTTLIEKFLAQFKDLMIIILLIAAVIAGIAGERADAIIILTVVILNAIFGVFQEAKAENAIDSLKQMAAPMATVIRDGHETRVNSAEIVPGGTLYY